MPCHAMPWEGDGITFEGGRLRVAGVVLVHTASDAQKQKQKQHVAVAKGTEREKERGIGAPSATTPPSAPPTPAVCMPTLVEYSASTSHRDRAPKNALIRFEINALPLPLPPLPSPVSTRPGARRDWGCGDHPSNRWGGVKEEQWTNHGALCLWWTGGMADK